MRRVLPSAAVAAALLVGAVLLATGGARRAGAAVEPPAPPDGRSLYTEGCSSCHGLGGQGSSRGPSLIGRGRADVDFWVSSGRMPLARPIADPPRKPPAYTRPQIDALIDYVETLGPGGTDIPSLSLASGDLSTGQDVYSTNCGACHSSAGMGGALSFGRRAPQLHPATARQVAEAVRVGPGNMPQFGPDQISDKDLNDLVRYVLYLHHPNDRGGAGLGHTGPTAEGFVALIVGLGALIGIIWWIGDRA